MINLFQFQEVAAACISDRVSTYLDDPVTVGTRRNPHDVPFFQALSAITGAGKTVILAEAVAQISDTLPVKPIIMWLSRGKVIVEQTFANLSPRGKYHHVLDGASIHALADYAPDAVAEAQEAMVFFATVGTFNQKDKESGTLKVHQSDVDTMESSVWDALRLRTDSEGRRRPLIVVYDEAQNLSDQQTELLLELEPDGFLLASATMRLPARIGDEVAHLKRAGWTNDELVTAVDTPDVVTEGLVKLTVLVGGYNAPMEETVANLLADMTAATAEAEERGLDFRPKAMYVCNTNVVADTPNQTDSAKQPFNQRQAPPILIWRYLVEQMGVDPATVAVYADLKTDRDHPLPPEFILFKGGDKDYDDFTAGEYRHVIFNLTLQEGWDDPSVYFAYIDKSMGSSAQITQVIGRVLRQPGAVHYPDDRLNTASFYVRVDKNAVFNEVVEDVKKQLGTSIGGVRIVVSPPGRPKPQDYRPKAHMEVPLTGLDALQSRARSQGLLDGFPDFRTDTINTKGTGSRRILRQMVGDSASETEWVSYEQASQASARWVLHREVQRQFRQALGVVNLADPKLDVLVGIGSPAHKQVCALAQEVVEGFIESVRLTQRRPNPYVVGSILARPDDLVPYVNAIHEGYAGLNPLERVFADAADSSGLPWCRNPARSGYGIPLITVGPTQNFYPDFLLWTDERVICVDTKGTHLMHDTAARKLLRIRPPASGVRLDIQFVSEGKFDANLERRDTDGYTRWGLGDDGKLKTYHFEDIDKLALQMIDDAANPA